MKASAAAECPRLTGEEGRRWWMDRGHSSPSTEAFFRTGTIVLSQGQRGEKEDEIEFLRKETWHSIEPFLKTPHIILKVALFLKALFIYFFKIFLQVSIHYVSQSCPMWFQHVRVMNGQKRVCLLRAYFGHISAVLTARPGYLSGLAA